MIHQSTHIRFLDVNLSHVYRYCAEILETTHSKFERLFNIFYGDHTTSYMLGYNIGFKNLYFIDGNILNGFVSIHLSEEDIVTLDSSEKMFLENIEGL